MPCMEGVTRALQENAKCIFTGERRRARTLRIAVDVLCSVRARPCRLSSAASHGLTRALRVAGFHANDMSYRPLHVNSFEVDSPDVKYGCASSLALLSPPSPRVEWPLSRHRRTASHPARAQRRVH